MKRSNHGMTYVKNFCILLSDERSRAAFLAARCSWIHEFKRCILTRSRERDVKFWIGQNEASGYLMPVSRSSLHTKI